MVWRACGRADTLSIVRIADVTLTPALKVGTDIVTSVIKVANDNGLIPDVKHPLTFFPAVSLEGRQMWLLRSSPLDLRALLWSKYWVGTLPLLILGLILTGLTNALLEVTPFMMILSLTTMAGLTLAISAMALAFGTLYPQFETENAAQIPTSFGGLVFMMATIALLAAVLGTLSRAVYTYVRSAWEGQAIGITPEMLAWFAMAAALCTAATIVPLRMALRKMESFEF